MTTEPGSKSDDKPNRSMDTLAVIIIMLGFVWTGIFYGDLPDPFPTSFGADGKAQAFMPLPWGAVILPLAAVAALVLLRVLPYISPQGFSMDGFLGAYQKVVTGAIAFMIAIHIGLIWRVSQGYEELGSWVPVLVGLLLALVGNYMNKTERNFFMGIRTPWTLADPEVWARTHRLGGWALMLLGVTLVLSALILSAQAMLIIIVTGSVGIALGLVGYSYWLYRRLNP